MQRLPVFGGQARTPVHKHSLQRQSRSQRPAPTHLTSRGPQAFFSESKVETREPIFVAQNPRFRLPPFLSPNYQLKPGWMASIDQAQDMVGFLLHNENRTHVPIHELEALDCEELLAHYQKEMQQKKGRLMHLTVAKGIVLEERYPTFGLHLLTYLCPRGNFKINDPVSIEEELAYAARLRREITASQLKL